MDLRFAVNFGGAYGGANFSALAYFDAEIYGHVLHICDLCAGLLAELQLATEIQWAPQTDFNVSICGSVAMHMNLCDEFEWSESAKLEGTLSSANGPVLDVTFGETCGGQADLSDRDCPEFN
jgi:hypothetical protein